MAYKNLHDSEAGEYCQCGDCVDRILDGLTARLNKEYNHILFIVPDSAGDVFLSTALLPSIKQIFPDKKLFFSTRKHNFPILKNNKYIHELVEFSPMYYNAILQFQGIGKINGLFDVVYTPCVLTQIFPNYQYNGLKAHNLEFK